MSMVNGLIGNASVLLALILAYSLLVLRLQRAGQETQLLSGALFGLAAVVGMTYPVTLAPGVFFDARTVVISMAGLFGGPMAAGISALIAVAYRAWLGGPGVAMGIATILTAAVLGSLFHALRAAGRVKVDLKTLAVFSLAVHLLALAWGLILPTELRGQFLQHVALPFLLALPTISVLLGLLLHSHEQLIDDERSVRESRDRLLELSDTLKRERALFSTVINTIPDLIWLKDPDGVYLTCNRRFEQFFGAPENHIRGRTDRDFLPEELVDFFRGHDLNALKADGPVINEETVTYASDGHQEFVETIKTPMRDADGRLIGVLGIARNIGQQLETQEALRRERDQMERVLETVDTVILALDPADRVTLINRKGCQLLGNTLAELAGQDWFVTTTPPDLDVEQTRAAFRLQAQRGADSTDPLTTRIRTADGREWHIAWRNSLILDDDGATVGLLAAGDDVTERDFLRRRLETIVRHVPGFIYQYQQWPDGRRKFPYVSDGIQPILGLEPADLAEDANSALDMIDPRDKARVLASMVESMRTLEIWQESFRACLPDGPTIWLEAESSPEARADGSVAWYGHFRDITERKRAEKKALEMTATLEAALSSMRDAVVVVDTACRLVHANAAFAAFHRFVRVQDCPQVLSAYADLLELRSSDGALLTVAEWPIARALRGEAAMDQEYRLRRKDTDEIWIGSYNLAPIQRADGTTIGAVMTCRDVTDLKIHEAELDYRAHHDLLTGLPNRRLLTKRLDEAIARSNRSGHSLALCYLDLDGFKALNDAHGHELGDEFLIKIGSILQQVLRDKDCVARLGGDEFVLLLTDLHRTEDCRPLVDRVLTQLRQPIRLHDVTHQVSASIGVALYPADYSDADTLLRHADQAMYRAKEAGKNQCRFHDAQRDALPRFSNDQLSELRAALDQRAFRLHFQPQVDLISRDVLGVEALIRWQHPDKGLLAPGAFLPQVEGTPLEWELGNWVIDAALRQLAEWNAQGLRLAIGINIGAGQLMGEGFAEGLADHLRAHPTVDPKDVELEILESTAFTDFEKARHILADCLELGVRFALDDFGTGYSSLAYFRALPIEVLKIDQCFVRDMLDDPGDMEIVESVVRLSQAFNRAVIAEGIETLEHAALLTWLGCRRGQGYGIAPPMPAADLPGWISRWSAQPDWRSADDRSGREDMQVLVAAQNHLHWITRVIREIEVGEISDLLDVRATDCAFRSWHAGPGAEHYGDLPMYSRLDKLHRSIHDLAVELLAQASGGYRQAAVERLPALHGLRDELLAAMGELVRQLRPMR